MSVNYNDWFKTKVFVINSKPWYTLKLAYYILTNRIDIELILVTAVEIFEFVFTDLLHLEAASVRPD